MRKSSNDINVSHMDTRSPCTNNDSTTPGGSNQRRRGVSRFSIRRLLYASPLGGRRLPRSVQTTSKNHHRPFAREGTEARSSSSSRINERFHPEIRATNSGPGAFPHQQELQKTVSRSSVFTTSTAKSGEGVWLECPLCLAELSSEEFPELMACGHRSCYNCLQQYLRIEISESRVCIACPECAEPMHPNEIRSILDDNTQYEKYEDFMVRRVLAVDPDTRWCPAPDCSYAVVATGCASCPKLHCERPGCDSYFCYHCKAEWHPNQTCDAARAQRSPNVRSSSVSFSQDSRQNDIKPCPRCQVLIVKMDDGSCNHMMCAVCGAEFCWLCMKEISDLHYLSPSGCTFWGKKPWSRKKKILWQLGTLVGAPVGIALVAGIAVPAMIIGIPVWIGRKLYTRYRSANKHKRNAAIIGGVTASILVSPVLAAVTVGIGVPILLFYVYGVVPVSLCRSGGCGVTTSGAGVKFEFDDENDYMSQLGQLTTRNQDTSSIDALSHRGVNPSIGEVSLSMVSGSQTLRIGQETDRESASNIALAGASLAGSITSSCVPSGQRLEIQVDVLAGQRFSMSSETASATTSLSEKSVNASLPDDGGASTRALAGSVLNYKPSVSETCSLATNGGGEDCGSERVRFDDNVSFIAPHSFADKTSIGSTRSWRMQQHSLESESTPRPVKVTLARTDHISSNESIVIDTELPIEEHKPTRNISTAATLRRLFFHSNSTQQSNDGGNQLINKSTESTSSRGIQETNSSTMLPVIPEPPVVSTNNIKIDISML
ncbi:E3 ubiquitin-protein ligase RNF19A-like [Chrysoperla carnea]|uniref:E3 ubiquitin-protein ligase RNF19A-like n=1 Tax=Chrysoperla carnea TaxID=189513 RepID=UPI001D073A08|nr:E3 ubiquitin-protein ligase RNF19A-like [Chrysoperla carnea]